MKKSVSCLFIISLIFITGCKTLPKPLTASSTPQTATTIEQQSKAQQIRGKQEITVAVVPFTEKRDKTNKYTSAYQYLIPLVPYGTIRYERPEDARTFNCPEEARTFNAPNEYKFSMGENLAKTLFNELEQRKIFAKTLFSQDPAKIDTDLILSGDINSTLYEGKTYSYGISFLSPVLWCIGLPAGSSYNKLNLTLYLKKKDTNEIIWTYILNKEKLEIQGLYYNRGKDVNNYAILLKEEIDNIVKNLKRRLSKIPIEQLQAKTPETPAPTKTEELSASQPLQTPPENAQPSEQGKKAAPSEN